MNRQPLAQLRVSQFLGLFGQSTMRKNHYIISSLEAEIQANTYLTASEVSTPLLKMLIVTPASDHGHSNLPRLASRATQDEA